METAIVANEKDKPVFDEQTLARLIEAAFVLQEHSHELRELEAELGLKRDRSQDHEPAARIPEPTTSNSNTSAQPRISSEDNGVVPQASPEMHSSGISEDADYALTVLQVTEIQRLIQTDHLKPNDALAMITGHVIEICGAAGAAVGLVNERIVTYRAVAGMRTPSVGLPIPLASTLCRPCLRDAQVFRCPDAKLQPLVIKEECRSRGIGSYIAVPVFQDAGIAGCLELYYSDSGAFTDRDVHTCQLMAGIVTDVLSGAEKSSALESGGAGIPSVVSAQPSIPSQESLSSVVCYKCGHKVVGQEQFCGQCGAARSEEREPTSMQSKVASLWHMQQANAELGTAAQASPLSDSGDSDSDGPSALAAEVPINMRSFRNSPVADALEQASGSPDVGIEEEAKDFAEQPDTTEASLSADWSSALSAREFLEQFASGNRRGALARVWNSRRGDIYLGIALILVLVIIPWGLWSHRPVTAPTPPVVPPAVTHKQPAAPEVSTLDRMLISLGLAESPQPPEDRGNPATAVWVDLHTGLYYCPGTDVYGKTRQGKFTSQRDAQLDQFSPAFGKACE